MALDIETQKKLASQYAEGLLPTNVKEAVERQIASGRMRPIDELVSADKSFVDKAIDASRYVSEPILQSRRKLGYGIRNTIGEIGNAVGLIDQGDLDVWKDEAAKEIQRGDNMMYTQGVIPNIIEFGMDVAPWVVGGALSGGTKLAANATKEAIKAATKSNILSAAGWGAGAGATQFTPEDGLIPILKNATIGAGLGAGASYALPYVLKGAGKVAQKTGDALKWVKDIASGNMPHVKNHVFQGIDAEDFARYPTEKAAQFEQKQIRKAVEAGNRLGTPITPAEAAPKSSLTGIAQGDITRSRVGFDAQKGHLINRQLNERARVKDLTKALGQADDMAAANLRTENFLNDRSQAFNRQSAERVQSVLGQADDMAAMQPKAQNILQSNIDEFETASRARVNEAYEPLKGMPVTDDVMKLKTVVDDTGKKQAIVGGGLLKKDPILSHYYNKFTATPEYKALVKRYSPKSYTVMNELKKYIDEDVGRLTSETRGAYTRGRGIEVQNSLSKLKGALDKHEELYPNIRAMAQSEIGARQALKESPIGTFANLKTSDSKTFSNELFNIARTSDRSRKEIFSRLEQAEPGLYNKLLRGWFDENLDKIDLSNPTAVSKLYEKAKRLAIGNDDIQKIIPKEIAMREAFDRSPIGVFSKLKSTDARSLSDAIFSPSVENTSRNVLKKELERAEPGLYNKLLREWFESKIVGMDSNNLNAASTIYNNVLKDDKTFKMLIASTKGNPQAQKFLLDMKRAYPGVMNNLTAKAGAFREKQNLADPRNWVSAFKVGIQKLLGESFERNANEYIFSGKWLPDLERRWARGAIQKEHLNALQRIGEKLRIDPKVSIPGAKVAVEMANDDDIEAYEPIDYDAEQEMLRQQGR